MHGFGGFLFWGHLRCLSFPPPTLGRGCQRGSGSTPSPASVLSVQHRVPPCVRAGWRAAGALPTLPGTRGKAGPERSSAAEGSLPLVVGSRAADPSRAGPCAGLRWQARCYSSPTPAQPDPVPDPRGPLRSPGRAEMLARPRSRLCLLREPLGAIPTATQARPPSQTPPLLPAPPLPPGGRRGSETVRV